MATSTAPRWYELSAWGPGPDGAPADPHGTGTGTDQGTHAVVAPGGRWTGGAVGPIPAHIVRAAVRNATDQGGTVATVMDGWHVDTVWAVDGPPPAGAHRAG